MCRRNSSSGQAPGPSSAPTSRWAPTSALAPTSAQCTDRANVRIRNIMKVRAPDSLFGTFKKSSISEDIVENLLTLIRERELHPGDKLPPERELAATMQVSRPSLRE